MLKIVSNLLKSPIIEPLYSQLITTQLINRRYLYLTNSQCYDATREAIRKLGRKDQGVQGETVVDVDDILYKDDLFPNMHTPNRLYEGIPFKDLPIINIKCTKNNTIMTLTDGKGLQKYLRSCGTEGFKTAKKGTNVAAQATAIALSKKAFEVGYKTVRIRVRGLGPGRMASIKGLEMAGINIVSITDATRVCWNPRRPKKRRRV